MWLPLLFAFEKIEQQQEKQQQTHGIYHTTCNAQRTNIGDDKMFWHSLIVMYGKPYNYNFLACSTFVTRNETQFVYRIFAYLLRRLLLCQAIIMFISMTFNIVCCHSTLPSLPYLSLARSGHIVSSQTIASHSLSSSLSSSLSRSQLTRRTATRRKTKHNQTTTIQLSSTLSALCCALLFVLISYATASHSVHNIFVHPFDQHKKLTKKTNFKYTCSVGKKHSSQNKCMQINVTGSCIRNFRKNPLEFYSTSAFKVIYQIKDAQRCGCIQCFFVCLANFRLFATQIQYFELLIYIFFLAHNKFA